MKKYIPYVIGGIAVAALFVLVLTTPANDSKTLDERITLRQKDKIPYGTYAAYHLLPALFPGATFRTEKKSPVDWIVDTAQNAPQAIFVTARFFEPENHELLRIIQFVEAGNYVFLMANSLSDEAATYFGTSGSGMVLNANDDDSLVLQLNNPPFPKTKSFIYPGKKWDSYFLERDKYRTQLMGTDSDGYPNFLQLSAGRGRLFVHLAPLAFSNYFILHKRNAEYFQKAVSLIPAHVENVVWNEYYLSPKQKNEKSPNILSVLWQFPSFKWALLTAIATLICYTLIEMKRRRQFIPVAQKPVNDSLDYVRTLGRLYYDKKDHQNLARKMTAVFLDNIRSRYHVFAQKMDAEFLEEIHLKTGYDRTMLQEILTFIEYIQSHNNISEQQLARYHQRLENFYQTTGHGRTII